MSKCQHVNPDLVSAPCVKLRHHQAIPLLTDRLPSFICPNRNVCQVRKVRNLCVCGLPCITHSATAKDCTPQATGLLNPTDPFADFRHLGINPTMDKADVLLTDIRGAPLHAHPACPHIGLCTEEHTTGLHVQAVQYPELLKRVLADWVVRPQVLLQMDLHLLLLLAFLWEHFLIHVC